MVEEILPFPFSLEYVWRWFCDLHSARSVGMALNPITWPDMAAYFGLKAIRPDPWELDLIHALDGIALKASHEKKPEEPKAEKFKPKAGTPRLRGKRKKP